MVRKSTVAICRHLRRVTMCRSMTAVVTHTIITAIIIMRWVFVLVMLLKIKLARLDIISLPRWLMFEFQFILVTLPQLFTFEFFILFFSKSPQKSPMPAFPAISVFSRVWFTPASRPVSTSASALTCRYKPTFSRPLATSTRFDWNHESKHVWMWICPHFLFTQTLYFCRSCINLVATVPISTWVLASRCQLHRPRQSLLLLDVRLDE